MLACWHVPTLRLHELATITCLQRPAARDQLAARLLCKSCADTAYQSRCRREAEDAHASLGQEHSSALEQLRAGHESEVEQLAEQIIQLDARLQRATADAEQHALTAQALQQRMGQQEVEAKAAAAQASSFVEQAVEKNLHCLLDEQTEA